MGHFTALPLFRSSLTLSRFPQSLTLLQSSGRLRRCYIAGQHFLFIFIFIAFLTLTTFPLACQDSLLPKEFTELFEKVELEELPPADEYYVDDAPLHQILKLFDEEDYSRQKAFLEEKQKKIIKSCAGIAVPEQKYSQDIIHDYLARYLTKSGKENLCRILNDGEIYRLFVREELKKRNMPAILEFLPVVESEYKATAKSRSGARGMWQFMENSMHPFLKKSDWIDERLDPWKSTKAALSKLQDNYKVLGDWSLAIAAYNCGLGAIRRSLKKSDEKSFWALAEKKLIPEETINYLPKLLAIAEIAENSEEYAVEIPLANEKIRYYEFDYITTEKEISISRLSSELRIDEEILKWLNRELLKETTPPGTYELRLPSGLKTAAEEALKEILK